MQVPAKKTVSFFFAITMVGVLFCINASGQGKIVINELLHSPGGSPPCSDLTNEFIELRNMGPGPQNIACYVLTNGTYSITLPSVTLTPGQTYLLGGQNNIYSTCSPTNVSVPVNLNWYTCGCTNTTIPTSGDGLMSSSASGTLLFLYDNNKKFVDGILDAGATTSGFSSITTASGSAGCASYNLKLSDSLIAGSPALARHTYESVGANTGAGSSYERKEDGGCSWDKNTSPTPGIGAGGVGAVTGTEATTINCPTSTTPLTASTTITLYTPSFPVNYSYVYASDAAYTTNLSYSGNLSASSSTFTISPASVGYYSILMSLPGSTCGETRLEAIVYNPIVSATSNTNPATTGATTAPGSATISITPSTPSDYYKMYYTLSKLSPTTVVKFDSTNSSPINLSGLSAGNYEILLDPDVGCNTTVAFTIGSIVLPIQLFNFSGSNIGSNNKFEIIIDADAELDQLILESSSDAKLFTKVANIPFENKKGIQKISFDIPASTNEFFRIVMIDIFGKRLVSEVVKIKNNNQDRSIMVFPNPFQEYITLQHYSRNEDLLIACLLSINGAIIKEENFKLLPGLNNFRISTAGISKGNYLLSLKKTSSPNIQYNNIIKQ
jgi:hypothetical protein